MRGAITEFDLTEYEGYDMLNFGQIGEYFVERGCSRIFTVQSELRSHFIRKQEKRMLESHRVAVLQRDLSSRERYQPFPAKSSYLCLRQFFSPFHKSSSHGFFPF